MALTDPRPTLATLRATCEDVLAAGEQQEQLIEALLTLARSQRGLDRREPLDLADITAAPCTPASRTPLAAGWPSAPRSPPPPSLATPASSSGWLPT